MSVLAKKIDRKWEQSSTARLGTPKVLSMEEVRRPEGYAIPGFSAVSVTVELEGIKNTGFGEGPAALALEKATSEAIERATLKWFWASSGSKESSNGWAAHISAELATRGAIYELIERDVALTTWENGGPFYFVPETLWPETLKLWKRRLVHRPEYFNLKILLGQTEKGAAVSALLFNERGNFVGGHASGYNLGNVILSATNECLRAAHIAVRLGHFSDVARLHSNQPLEKVIEPGVHALAYAYHVPLPREVELKNANAEEILARWSSHQEILDELRLDDFHITLFHTGNRIVARVKSEKYKPMYWGKGGELTRKNMNPHFVG